MARVGSGTFTRECARRGVKREHAARREGDVLVRVEARVGVIEP